MSWHTRHRLARFPRWVLIVVAATLLVGAVGLGAVAAGADAGRPHESHTVEWLEKIERQRLDALVDVDVAILERRHAANLELIPPPGFPLARDEYLRLVAAGDLDYLTFEPVSAIEIRLHGNAAVMWYRSMIDIVAAGQGRFTHEAWHLYLYEKRRGTWQVAREQATAVGGFPPQAVIGQQGGA